MFAGSFCFHDSVQIILATSGVQNLQSQAIRDYAKEELTAFPRKVAELTASARNDSGQPIRYAQFCVQAARRMKGCDFQLKTHEVWKPGEELVWTLDGHARRGIENAHIVLVKIKSDPVAARTAELEPKPGN